MSRRDASAEDTAVVEAEVATVDEAGTAIGEETTIKEEDTENTVDSENSLFDVIRLV